MHENWSWKLYLEFGPFPWDFIDINYCKLIRKGILISWTCILQIWMLGHVPLEKVMYGLMYSEHCVQNIPWLLMFPWHKLCCMWHISIRWSQLQVENELQRNLQWPPYIWSLALGPIASERKWDVRHAAISPRIYCSITFWVHPYLDYHNQISHVNGEI